MVLVLPGSPDEPQVRGYQLFDLMFAKSVGNLFYDKLVSSTFRMYSWSVGG